MTDPATAERLAALQRSRQASSSHAKSPSEPRRETDNGNPGARPTSRSGSGTKWTLAGGAVGATLTLMGAMAAGQGLTTEADPTPQPAATATPAPQIIVVVSQPAAGGSVNAPANSAQLTDLTQTINETVAELPEPVPQQEPAGTAKRTESGGS